MKKTFLTATVALATFAGVASATVPTAGFENELRSFAPNVDVADLTSGEINSILSIIHSSDSNGEKRASIQALVK